MNQNIENREFFIKSPPSELFLQSWSNPETNPSGCVLITHGLGEHSQCYDSMAQTLCHHGFLVYAWDLRGHGKSHGQRGVIESFDDYTKDFFSVIKEIKKNSGQELPFHLISHSMGALITLQTLLKKNCPKITSGVLSSPCLELSLAVPAFKKILAQWLNQFWPKLTLKNGIAHPSLSRDPETVKSYSRDPLRHSKISAPLFIGMTGAMESVFEKASKIKTPLFFQLAGQDRIVENQKSLRFFECLNGPKKLKIYDESYHEIYNDLDREEVLSDLVDYLHKHP